MEPSYQDYLEAWSDAVKAFRKRWFNFHPRIRRTFATLFWAIFPPLQFRSHESNWPKQIWVDVIEVYHGDDTLRLFGRRQPACRL